MSNPRATHNKDPANRTIDVTFLLCPAYVSRPRPEIVPCSLASRGPDLFSRGCLIWQLSAAARSFGTPVGLANHISRRNDLGILACIYVGVVFVEY